MTRRRDRLAFRVLAAITPRADRDALLGDLLEEHAERGGLGREAVRAIPAVLSLRARRAGGWRAIGCAGFAGALAAAAILVAVTLLWHHVLHLVPRRAAGSLPVAWRVASVLPALLAGALAGRLAWSVATHLLGDSE